METVSQKVQKEKENAKKEEISGEIEVKEADFEAAMEIAGFGLYNFLVLLGALFTLVGAIFETSAISYVLPNAECDLKLTLMDKGVINAITYAGMIAAAFPCGYLSDTFGRKKILCFSCLLHGISVMCLALSQNVVQLIVAKFFGGVFMCGPSAAIMSYVMEMHGKRHRERILMVVGSMLTTAQLLLPLMALGILTKKWDPLVFGLIFNPWNAYLAVSSIPSFVAGILFIILPESPKFLMSINEPGKALDVLRQIYSVNKFKPKNTFPISHLKVDNGEDHTGSTVNVEYIDDFAPAKTEEKKNVETSGLHKFRQSLLMLKPMLQKPYLGLALQIYSLNFCILLGKNTLRLWLPQLFASINEYEQISSEPSDMCTILSYSLNKTETVINFETEKCEVFFTASTYYNNIIVAVAGFGGYIVAGFVINRLGAIRITTISLLISSIFGFALYWSTSKLTTLIFSAGFSTVSSLSGTSLIGTSVNLFPTNLRTMVVALQMMFGRVGSLAGNILFPIFISLGCIPPFLLIGGMMLTGSFMSGFLPNKSGSALK